jgi:hypothetical protein
VVKPHVPKEQAMRIEAAVIAAYLAVAVAVVGAIAIT